MEKGKIIKVAFFAEVLKENLDGVTYTLYNIVNNIPKKEFEYLFITPYPPSADVDFPFPVVVCPYIKFPLYQAYPLAIPFFSRRMKRILDEFNPDLIHFTTPAFLGTYAAKYAIRNNILLFSTYHTHFMAYIDYYLFFRLMGGTRLWKGWAGKIMRWIYNACAMTFVPTDPIKNELIDIGIDANRLVTWGRGIETDLFNPSFRNDAYIDELAGKGTKRILFVSRLVWEKEIRTLMGIYDYFEKRNPGIKMILTGDGPKINYLKKKMPNAVFTGKLIGRELSRIYASSDLFVFPSVTETFGNVVLEALASGLPCVVAAKGGPMGIVKHGITGFHAKPKNVNDFCEKISIILNDRELYSTMKKEAVSYAESQNWNDLCNRMFSIYREALGKKKNA